MEELERSGLSAACKEVSKNWDSPVPVEVIRAIFQGKSYSFDI